MAGSDRGRDLYLLRLWEGGIAVYQGLGEAVERAKNLGREVCLEGKVAMGEGRLGISIAGDGDGVRSRSGGVGVEIMVALRGLRWDVVVGGRWTYAKGGRWGGVSEARPVLKILQFVTRRGGT